jgi:hypothetical protein
MLSITRLSSLTVLLAILVFVIFNLIGLSIVMLNVVMLSFIVFSTATVSVVMLSAMASKAGPSVIKHYGFVIFA